MLTQSEEIVARVFRLADPYAQPCSPSVWVLWILENLSKYRALLVLLYNFSNFSRKKGTKISNFQLERTAGTNLEPLASWLERPLYSHAAIHASLIRALDQQLVALCTKLADKGHPIHYRTRSAA